MKRIKACRGWYKTVKYLERRMVDGRVTNNFRRLHGMSPQRKIKKVHQYD
jgi:hypothetical protein